MNRTGKLARNYKSKMWKRCRQSKTYTDLVEYKRAQKRQLKSLEKQRESLRKHWQETSKTIPRAFMLMFVPKLKLRKLSVR